MKRMLINATQAEERRLAIVNGQKLLDYEIEIEGREQRKKATSTKRWSPGLSPAWKPALLTMAKTKYGFLPFKEISRQYLQQAYPSARHAFRT